MDVLFNQFSALADGLCCLYTPAHATEGSSLDEVIEVVEESAIVSVKMNINVLKYAIII